MKDPLPEVRQLFAGIPPELIGDYYDWREVDDFGYCVNTGCYAGFGSKIYGPDFRDCFNCGVDCANGCGPKWGPSWPGDFFGFYSFERACYNHDYCYSAYTKYTKKECDLAFLANMLRSCNPFGSDLNPLQIIALPLRGVTLACIDSALIMYNLVAGFGDKAYTDEVKKQNDFELSEKCELPTCCYDSATDLYGGIVTKVRGTCCVTCPSGYNAGIIFGGDASYCERYDFNCLRDGSDPNDFFPATKTVYPEPVYCRIYSREENSIYRACISGCADCDGPEGFATIVQTNRCDPYYSPPQASP